MTKLLILTILVLSIVICTGCAKEQEETTAVQVENPEVDRAQGAPSETPPPMPSPGTEPAKAEKGFTLTESGLQYKDVKAGKGPAAAEGDRVTVHYKGTLNDGTVFDSSRKPGGSPFALNLGKGDVIKGWDEGLQGMKAGGVRELIIPPKLGYGDMEMGRIPPNSTLRFTVEMLEIKKSK